MNTESIRSIFNGLDVNTLELVVKSLRHPLSKAIADIQPYQNIVPPPELILNAFKLCSVNDIKVVLIGQDPYINPGEAMGLSFSVPRSVKKPRSLNNIYKCLLNNKLITKMPMHGDLTNWAAQGVLLLNVSLTTVLNRSGAHICHWKPYTDKLIENLSNLPYKIIFVLFGESAKTVLPLINHQHDILTWGHPSPLNKDNQSDNPRNFIHCDVFTKINQILESRSTECINWDPDYNQFIVADLPTMVNVDLPKMINSDCKPLTDNILWVFTDGGCSANGRTNSNASWAFYMTDGHRYDERCDLVKMIDIADKKYRSSNNRGELTAILKALEYIIQNTHCYIFTHIIIVSDSEYSINCINEWVITWLNDSDKMKDKKNIDIIVPARKLLDQIQNNYSVEFKHIRSHKKEPLNKTSEEYFLWKGNDKVDKLCAKLLTNSA